MSTKIDGAVALVTGSNRGIGRALVEALLERGARKVYATARDPRTLDELRAAHGDRVEVLALDVTDPRQVREVAAAAPDAEILINNAGYAEPLDVYTVDDLSATRREFEVNYFGLLDMIRAFAPVLRANGGGVIANLVSVGGLVNFPLLNSYSDSKAAAHSATQAARLLLQAQGTRVLGVYPGPVDTDMAKGVPMDKTPPRVVAEEILDGIESGATDVFPDPMSKTFAAAYDAGDKVLESGVAAMLAQG